MPTLNRFHSLLYCLLLCLWLPSATIAQSPAESNLDWHTFLNSSEIAQIIAISQDESGRSVAVGISDSSWGEPLAPHNGGQDILVAQFSRGGQLLWHTYIGGSGYDEANSVVVSADGQIILVGTTDSSWGDDILRPHTGQRDIVVAQVSGAGKLKWTAFFGSESDDLAGDIALDIANDQIVVVGSSDTSWGEPKQSHQGESDIALIYLMPNGAYDKHTFLGGPGFETGNSVAVDNNGVTYVGGTSSASWGDPVLSPHTDSRDAFLSKIQADGSSIEWNNFMGSEAGSDSAESIATDEWGNIYVAGYSWDTWGEPTHPFAGIGHFDGFTAKFDTGGNRLWHTFFGSESDAADADSAYGVTTGPFGRVYVVGDSRETWGTPLEPFSGERDGFLLRLDPDTGGRIWQTFFGGPAFDYGNDVMVDSNGNPLVAGYSQAPWFTDAPQPVLPFGGEEDGFLARYPSCLPKCAKGDVPTAVAQAPTESENTESSPTTTPTPTTDVEEPETTTDTETEDSTSTADNETEQTATEGEDTPDSTSTEEPTATVSSDEVATDATPTPDSSTETVETDDQQTLPEVTGDLELSQLFPQSLVQNGVARIPLASYGHGDATLRGPYDTVSYEFTVPENWIIDGGYVRMDYSFMFNTDGEIPNLLGHFTIMLDDMVVETSPLEEATIINNRYRITLPAEILNDPNQRTHTLTFILDSSAACIIPHDSRLLVHTTGTQLLFEYNETPLDVDLGRYPQPYDKPRLVTWDSENDYSSLRESLSIVVLPEEPTIEEMQAGLAISARLGNLGVDILTLSDQELLNRLAADRRPKGSFVVIGSPDRNKVTAQLNRWGSLPIPFREQRFNLNSEGPATVTAGEQASYNLRVTNPTDEPYASVLVSTTLPEGVQVDGCSPNCTQKEQEISWFIQSISANEVVDLGYTIRIPDDMTDETMLETTTIVLDETSNPLSMDTQQTVVGSEETTEEDTTEIPNASVVRYFLAEQGWGAQPTDGIVQTLATPWDEQEPMLVLTGLTNEGVYKAGQAMGTTQRLPGLFGTTAIINDVNLPERDAADVVPPPIAATFSELGQEDRILRGTTASTELAVDIPAGWRLEDGSALNLRFTHSQLLNFANSSLQVLFNETPLLEMMLDDETALAGDVEVKIPSSRVRSGRENTLTIQTRLEALDRCAAFEKNWLAIDGQSSLNFAYRPNDTVSPNFMVFPQPFSTQADLSDVIFILPAIPTNQEWQHAIYLAAMMGRSGSGTLFRPHIYLGDGWSEEALANNHIVVIGRPTRNPLLPELNDHLLQRFTPDADSLERQLNQVTFRSPPNVDLGILQLLPSPYNPDDYSLLVISGTSDEGVALAGETLLYRRHKLEDGNLAFIDEKQINVLDTDDLTESGLNQTIVDTLPNQFNQTKTASTDANPNSGNNPSHENTTAETARPQWLIPLVGIAAILIVATIALAYWQEQRKQAKL